MWQLYPGYITLELVTSSLYCLKDATLSSTMSFFKGISLSFRITLNTKIRKSLITDNKIVNEKLKRKNRIKKIKQSKKERQEENKSTAYPVELTSKAVSSSPA